MRTRLGGGIGRHPGLKIPWALRPCEFDSRPRHQNYIRLPEDSALPEAFFYDQNRYYQKTVPVMSPFLTLLYVSV